MSTIAILALVYVLPAAVLVALATRRKRAAEIAFADELFRLDPEIDPEERERQEIAFRERLQVIADPVLASELARVSEKAAPAAAPVSVAVQVTAAQAAPAVSSASMAMPTPSPTGPWATPSSVPPAPRTRRVVSVDEMRSAVRRYKRYMREAEKALKLAEEREGLPEFAASKRVVMARKRLAFEVRRCVQRLRPIVGRLERQVDIGETDSFKILDFVAEPHREGLEFPDVAHLRYAFADDQPKSRLPAMREWCRLELMRNPTLDDFISAMRAGEWAGLFIDDPGIAARMIEAFPAGVEYLQPRFDGLTSPDPAIVVRAARKLKVDPPRRPDVVAYLAAHSAEMCMSETIAKARPRKRSVSEQLDRAGL